jgi:hypothetical protein
MATRILGPTTSRRRFLRAPAVRKGLHRRRRTGFVATLVAVAAVLVFALAAATAPLPGSNFEIDDGNLKVDGASPPALDWANVNEQSKADKPTGSGDDSFGQGTKEDTAVPSVVSGSIPPNKSDLLNFEIYLEENASGRFLNMNWLRVQEPSGTTNMDFEFNKSKVLSANGVTPVRTAGDVLIQYDLAQGGTNPQLFASRWVASGAGSQCQASNSTPCWGTRVNLTAAGVATGSINTVAIPAAESDGLSALLPPPLTGGPLSPRTFGEAQVDLTALTGGGAPECSVFGSAYLKSRSSDSFNAALKDFIAPMNLDIDQCANVIIRKVTVPPSDPAAVRFGYTKDIDTSPSSANTFTLGHGENQAYDNVILGDDYTVVEDSIPANWQFTSLDCSASTGIAAADIQIVGAQVTADINNKDDILDCTYTNSRRLGAIEITKTRKHAATPLNNAHSGVNFTITGGNLPAGGTVVTTNASGVACLDGLIFGDYVVTESVPTGYVSDDAVKEVAVGVNSDCGDGNEAKLSFHNTPLTNVTVSVDSQVPGGTASVINCGAGNVSTDPVTGDGSTTVLNLQPTAPAVTLTCTVTVDP